MPRHRSAVTLRKACMLTLAKNWDLICYSVHSPREMGNLLESDGYLNFQGPFTDFPSTILEDLMDVIRSVRNLNRKFLHQLLQEQLLRLNLSYGVAEIYYGLQFLPRCKRLRELNLSYLQHVEPSHIMPILPYLTACVSLNLSMTLCTDPMLNKIAECCPNLLDLNLTSTYITDRGLSSLCGSDRCDGLKKCQKLQRLTINETRTTWVGAYAIIQNLPDLTDFDFDKIFQVFEHLDPESVKDESTHNHLKLKSLYSTAVCIRPDSIDAAAVLCPKTEILSIMNSWMDNEMFYKFMQFENLKTLTVFRNEGQPLDYEEGILPLLQVVGPTLENLILTKFTDIDLVTLGRSCPRLRKLALSGVKEFRTCQYGPVDGLFSQMSIMELWLDDDTEFESQNALLQLLHSSTPLECILIKQSNAFQIGVLKKVWETNPMPNISRLTLDHCNGMTIEVLEDLLRMDNDLTTIRLWSCSKISDADHRDLKNYIQSLNLDIYVEWFE